MADFEGTYNGFSSRFGDGAGAAQRGKFARFLDEGGGDFSQFAGQLKNTFKPPAGTNAAEETAFADAADGRNVEQWGQNLNRVTQQHDQFAQMGFNAVGQVQQVQQAKEMAQMNAQSAQQQGMFSAISSGIGLLGGIGGSLFSGGGSSAALPKTNWTDSSGINWQQTPSIGSMSYGGRLF